MADSFIQYTASGSTDTYSIPFGYLDPTHVSVSLDGVSTPFTFPSASQVQITSGNPTAGVVVEVRRSTPRDSREIVWQNASNLTASDLNTSDLQLLYITQEAFDLSATSMNVVSDGTFDALSKRIKNVAAPTDGNDAVNKTYADAILSQITSEVTDAETAATAAELAESNAEAILAQMVILYDDWDDRYLGSKATDPTVDNDGDTLEDGALYFNTTVNQLRVYDLGSTSWLVIDNTIAANSVSNTELSDMAVSTIKGRISSGTGDPEDLTAAQARTVMDVYSTTEVDAAVAAGGLDPQTPSYDSGNQTYTAGSKLTLAHGLGYAPLLWRVYLVCTTAEDNFSVGDIIELGNWTYTQAASSSYNYQTKVGAVNFEITTGANGLLAMNDSSTVVALTAANFKLRAVAY